MTTKHAHSWQSSDTAADPNLPDMCGVLDPPNGLCSGHHEAGIFRVGYHDNWPLVQGNINK